MRDNGDVEGKGSKYLPLKALGGFRAAGGQGLDLCPRQCISPWRERRDHEYGLEIPGALQFTGYRAMPLSARLRIFI